MRNADALNALDRDLRVIFAGRLQSLVSYGADTGQGPVATLALVDTLTPDDLRACAARVPGWHNRGLATPLIVPGTEFGRSLDAFPFEFGAIIAEHEVVSGADPFAGLAVDPADIRRACEVQARSHLLHLREDYIETEARADRVAALVAHTAPALAALLRHMTRLAGGPAPAAVLTRVAEIGSHGTISPDEARRIVPDYLAALERLVDELDRWSAA